MTFKARGFIIGKTDMREYDRLFTIYTLEYGKIEALAVGARKISSKLSGSLEVLTFATFTIAKGRQIDRITGVDTHHRFNDIANSLDHLASTLYCLEITERLVQGTERDEVLFLLLNDLLYAMNDMKDAKPLAIARLYLLKLCTALGYQPTVAMTNITWEDITQKHLPELLAVTPRREADLAVESVLQDVLHYPIKSQVFYDYLRGEAM